MNQEQQNQKNQIVTNKLKEAIGAQYITILELSAENEILKQQVAGLVNNPEPVEPEVVK